MMHNISELYKIKGDNNHIYTKEAVQFVNHTPIHKAKKGDCYNLIYRVATNKPFRIYNKLDSKEFTLGYQYGEHIYFDNEEELEDFRIEKKVEKILKNVLTQ